MSKLNKKYDPTDFRIRSIFLGQYGSKAQSGSATRDEFRLRFYDDATSVCLEKRSYRRGLCLKQSVSIPLKTGIALLQGDYEPLRESGPLCLELYAKLRDQIRIPKASWMTVARKYKKAS